MKIKCKSKIQSSLRIKISKVRMNAPESKGAAAPDIINQKCRMDSISSKNCSGDRLTRFCVP